MSKMVGSTDLEGSRSTPVHTTKGCLLGLLDKHCQLQRPGLRNREFLELLSWFPAPDFNLQPQSCDHISLRISAALCKDPNTQEPLKGTDQVLLGSLPSCTLRSQP